MMNSKYVTLAKTDIVRFVALIFAFLARIAKASSSEKSSHVNTFQANFSKVTVLVLSYYFAQLF